MNVKIEDLSSVRKKLSIEVTAEKVDSALDKAADEVAKTAKVKGFRKGKVPRRILDQQYAPQMQEKAFTSLINDSYFQALVEHKLPVVGNPQITDGGLVLAGQPFSYTAEVEIKPEVEAKDYTGLKLQKEKLVFDDSVVEKQLEELRQSRSELKVASVDAAADGHFLTIDFAGSIDGVAFEGGSAEGHVLELGSGTFIPGFEEQLIGMQPNDEREVNVNFPEEYGNKELAGKPALFKVKLQEIKEKVFPELDDDLAKEYGAEDLAGLKQMIEDNHRQQEQGRVESELKERLVGAIVERNPIEVPEVMVEQQLESMLNNLKGRLQQQGMSLEMLGMNEEAFAAQYRDNAIAQVQGSLLLEAVGQQEEIKAEDGEIDGKITEIAAMAQAPVDVVKDYYAKAENRPGLLAQIQEEKVMAFLLEKAEIEEVDKETLEAASGEAADDKE